MSITDSLLLGNSAPMQQVKHLIQQVARSNASVLILGESGTGKELVAQAIHQESPRSDFAYVPVNCGAIPAELLESELFGHEKGAFSGASSAHKGRFELANGGTLFLDEIGDMTMDLQVKLLRVLQERTIDPVGSTESKSIDVRVIAATHKNIEQLIKQGEFREDLFYRLNVMPMEIQALAQRKVDIPLLIEHFARLHGAKNNAQIRMTAWSLKLMVEYDWPGNVRELSNLMARYTALYPGQEVDLRHVPSSMIPSGIRTLVDQQSTDALSALLVDADAGHPESVPPEALQGVTAEYQAGPTDSATSHDQMDIFAPAEPVDEVQRIIMLAQGGASFPEEGMQLKQHLLEIERTLIKQALGKAKGNVSKTARLLNLQRTTLIEKINKYGLSEA